MRARATACARQVKSTVQSSICHSDQFGLEACSWLNESELVQCNRAVEPQDNPPRYFGILPAEFFGTAQTYVDFLSFVDNPVVMGFGPTAPKFCDTLEGDDMNSSTDNQHLLKCKREKFEPANFIDSLTKEVKAMAVIYQPKDKILYQVTFSADTKGAAIETKMVLRYLTDLNAPILLVTLVVLCTLIAAMFAIQLLLQIMKRAPGVVHTLTLAQRIKAVPAQMLWDCLLAVATAVVVIVKLVFNLALDGNLEGFTHRLVGIKFRESHIPPSFKLKDYVTELEYLDDLIRHDQQIDSVCGIFCIVLSVRLLFALGVHKRTGLMTGRATNIIQQEQETDNKLFETRTNNKCYK